jgi:hypothetical protein
MPAIVVLIFTFLVALILCLRGMGALKAWLLSCCIVPIFVLAGEFILPYMGGGASMWPIALIFGGLYGASVSSFGVLVQSF